MSRCVPLTRCGDGCTCRRCCPPTPSSILCKIKEYVKDILDLLELGSSTFASVDVTATGEAISSVPASLTDYEIFNSTSSLRYVRLYDANTAPDISTAVPKKRLLIPAVSGANIADLNVPFTYGIWIVASTGVADGDTNSPATNDLLINIGYKAT